MSRCKSGNQRHWFTRRGSVGEASPVCVRCGAPNPKQRKQIERPVQDAHVITNPSTQSRTSQTGSLVTAIPFSVSAISSTA